MYFYNYQFEYIIELILIVIYDKNKIKNHFYSSPKPFNNNNQVIQLSLVSKFFFNAVSRKLTELLDAENYFVLKGLIEKIKESDCSIIDSQYKLIKAQDSIRCYDYLYHLDQDPVSKFIKYNNGNGIFKSIHIGPGNSSYVEEILNNLSKYPSNFKFDLTVSIRDLVKALEFKDPIKLQEDLSKIRKVNLGCGYLRRELYDALMYLPKSIVYSDLDSLQNWEFSLVFKSTKNIKIEIDSLLFSNEYYSGENRVNGSQSISKFEEFKLVTSISSLILNNSQLNNLECWNIIVDKLSKEQSLKELYFARDFDGFTDLGISGLKVEDIMKGFRTILKSPSSRIQTLSLRGLEQYLLDGLASNNSIKTLILDSNDIQVSDLVQKVLIHNKSIRHLEFIETVNDIDILRLLKDPNYSELYDLYSVSFMFEKQSIRPYLDYIYSNSYSIKEFNFKNIYMGPGLHKKVQYQVVIKNSIVNITEYIPNPKVVKKWIVTGV